MERSREETRRMCFELQAWKGRRERNSIACFDEEKVNSLRAHFLVDDVNKRKSLEKYKYKFHVSFVRRLVKSESHRNNSR